VFAGWLCSNAHAREAVVLSKASDHHSMTELGHVRMALDPIFVADLAGEKYRIGGHASIEIGIVGLEVAASHGGSISNVDPTASSVLLFLSYALRDGLDAATLFTRNSESCLPVKRPDSA
jgi:hypothetical protein